MRFITFLTGLSAVIVAGCAAFFSVTGLGLLFSGATTAVIIMAASLEFGKLVAASYLHNYWNETNILMRTYLILGIVALVGITSAGIFGFLSNAYTQTKITVDQADSKVELYETQKENILSDIPRWESRIETLSENRTRQEVRYDSLVAGENWVNARRTTDLITESNQEIDKLNDDITRARVRADSLNQLIFETREANVDIEREIGGFRFIAQAFDKDVDTVVKWFVFLLIFVFDPFAVTMVLAFNTALAKDIQIKNKKDEYILHGEGKKEHQQSESDLKVVDESIEELEPINTLVKVKNHRFQGLDDEEQPTHYIVPSAGGNVIIKANRYDIEKHHNAIPLFDHKDDEETN